MKKIHCIVLVNVWERFTGWGSIAFELVLAVNSSFNRESYKFNIKCCINDFTTVHFTFVHVLFTVSSQEVHALRCTLTFLFILILLAKSSIYSYSNINRYDYNNSCQIYTFWATDYIIHPGPHGSWLWKRIPRVVLTFKRDF